MVFRNVRGPYRTGQDDFEMRLNALISKNLFGLDDIYEEEGVDTVNQFKAAFERGCWEITSTVSSMNLKGSRVFNDVQRIGEELNQSPIITPLQILNRISLLEGELKWINSEVYDHIMGFVYDNYPKVLHYYSERIAFKTVRDNLGDLWE